MQRITVGTVAASVLLLAPGVASAQSRWKEIGRTSSGNRVYVDPKSVHTQKALIDATVRVVFTTPVATPEGAWYSARTKATFDCVTRKLAAKENVYYGDAKETKVVERKVNKIPGFGPVLNGSLGAVAMDYFCRR
jgi:surface-adhesin protein E